MNLEDGNSLACRRLMEYPGWERAKAPPRPKGLLLVQELWQNAGYVTLSQGGRRPEGQTVWLCPRASVRKMRGRPFYVFY